MLMATRSDVVVSVPLHFHIEASEQNSSRLLQSLELEASWQHVSASPGLQSFLPNP